MKKWVIAAASALSVAIGYAATSTPVVAQAWSFPPVSGQTVTIHLDPSAGGFSCAVIAVRTEFIGCKGTGKQEGAEDWYNLRDVGRIHISGK